MCYNKNAYQGSFRLGKEHEYGCRKKGAIIKTVSYTRERASEKMGDMLTNTRTAWEHQSLFMLGS